MPLDPERPIEKLLRELAARHREQAGTPPTLHPATRRLLQAEVRKQYSLQSAASPNRFSIFRPAWGWALGAATALLMLTVVIISLDKGVREKPLTLAMGEEERYRVAVDSESAPAAPAAPSQRRAYGQYEESLARGSAVSNQPQPALVALADATTLAPTSVFRTVPSEGKELSLASVPTPPPAAQPVTGDSLGYTVVGGIGGVPARTEADALSVGVNLTTDVALAETVVAETPATRDLAVTAAAARLERAPSTLQAGRTAQPLTQVAAVDKSKAAAVASVAAPPVLASFQVEQRGESLSIVDNDGSVYTGTLQPVTPEREAITDVTMRSRQAAPSDRPSPALKPESAAVSQRLDQNQNFAFKVSGTNRSLKQNVVFTGNLAGPPLAQGLKFANNVTMQSEHNVVGQTFATSRALTNLAQTSYFGGGFIQENRKQVQFLLQNSISGQARLSDGRTVEVNALAVPSNQR